MSKWKTFYCCVRVCVGSNLTEGKPNFLMKRIRLSVCKNLIPSLMLLLSQVWNPFLLMLENQAGVLSCEIVSILTPSLLSFLWWGGKPISLGKKNKAYPTARRSYCIPQLNNQVPPSHAPPYSSLSHHWWRAHKCHTVNRVCFLL